MCLSDFPSGPMSLQIVNLAIIQAESEIFPMLSSCDWSSHSAASHILYADQLLLIIAMNSAALLALAASSSNLSSVLSPSLYTSYTQ